MFGVSGATDHLKELNLGNGVVSLKVVLDKDWVELIAAAKAMGLTKEEVLDFIRRKNQRREA
jgi:hypothetical protein